MSVYEVVEKCGRPDDEAGSGVYIFLYHLRDGTVGISCAAFHAAVLVGKRPNVLL